MRKKTSFSFCAILNKYYAKVLIDLSKEIIPQIRASLRRSSMMNPGRETEALTSSLPLWYLGTTLMGSHMTKQVGPGLPWDLASRGFPGDKFAPFEYFVNAVPAPNTDNINSNFLFFDLINQPIADGPQFDFVMILISSDPCRINVWLFKPSLQMRFELCSDFGCQFPPFFQRAW